MARGRYRTVPAREGAGWQEARKVMPRWLVETLIGILVLLVGGIVVYAADSALRFTPLVEQVGRLEEQVRIYAPLEGRVSHLEEQVRTYAPLVERVSHLEKNPDPIAEACASLARQIAAPWSFEARPRLKDAMQQLGCTAGKR